MAERWRYICSPEHICNTGNTFKIMSIRRGGKECSRSTMMKTRLNDNLQNKTTVMKNNCKQQKDKKPFDKKKYRLQKYSNKYKVDQWEERRKKAVLRRYYKELHKDQDAAPKLSLFTSKESKEDDTASQPKKKSNAFFAAKQEFLKKKEEKKRIKEAMLKSKAEREEALKKYKEKKALIYKKLSKKTSKGQPVMKDRMEMLLQKIQENT